MISVLIVEDEQAIVRFLRTALEADGWDTGLMVLGPQQAKEVVRREGLAVYMITKEGDKFVPWMSPQFAAFLVNEKN